MKLLDFANAMRKATARQNEQCSATQAQVKDTLARMESDLVAMIKPGRFLLDKAHTPNARPVVDEGADDDGDNTWLDRHATEKEVVVDHELIPIWQYLGDEYSARIEAIHLTRPGTPSSGLAIELHPHQDSGAEKLIFITSLQPYAGIVGDEMGLGKTLLTLEALQRVKERGLVRGCCDLIVAPKLCQEQWMAEIEFAYHPHQRPKAVILDNKDMTATDIITGEFDIIIVTYQYLLARHKAMQQALDFYEQAEELGFSRLMGQLRDKDKLDTRSRTTNALYSHLYDELELPFRHIVLDEGHLAKKENGRIHEAVRAIPKQRLIFLSGTFVPNRWTDLRGIMHLFPGAHPFDTPTRFNKAFGSLNQVGVYVEPSNSKRRRLIKYLMGLVVARPSSVMAMINLHVTYYEFLLNENDCAISTAWTYRYIMELKRSGGSEKTRDKKEMRAMMYAMRAQQYVSGRILVPEKALRAEEVVKQQGWKLLEAFLAQNAEDYSHGYDTNRFAGFETADFAVYLDSDALRATQKAGKKKEDSDSDSDSETEGKNGQQDKDPGNARGDGATPPSAQHGHVSVLDNEPPEVDVDEDEDTAAPPIERSVWLNMLKDAANEEVFTDKVKAVLELIEHIQGRYPREKIVVFSILLSFHDVLHEALQRSKRVARSITRIDGTCKNRHDAAGRLAAFEAAEPDAIALVTAGTGSFGVNMQFASKIIQAEPWWNLNVEKQAYYRCRRQGQENDVHVWIVRGLNSPIDFVIQNTRDKKEDTNVQIYGPLRRHDDEPPQIPDQMRSGIGEVDPEHGKTEHLSKKPRR